MENQRTYTLAELAGEFGLTERTTRYYIEKVLPPHHKKGRGKVARYGQDTWNCFAFIRLVRERYGFGPSQIGPLLRDISQDTVDRVVNGDEELAVMGVPTAMMNPAGRARGGLPRASERAAKFGNEEQSRPRKTEIPDQMMAFSLSEPAKLRQSTSPPAEWTDVLESVQNPKEPSAESDSEPDSEWHTLFADDQLQIRHRGRLHLTHLQKEQIEVAAWLIKEAL